VENTYLVVGYVAGSGFVSGFGSARRIVFFSHAAALVYRQSILRVRSVQQMSVTRRSFSGCSSKNDSDPISIGTHPYLSFMYR
jgi:hypothetical protein